MQKAITTLVKYVFLDVVGFTQNRSVEAQTEIVDSLNSLVRTAITDAGAKFDQVILLPTGDGLCIAITDGAVEFDIHIKIALQILRALHEHNESTTDEMRKFQLRIGINENVDNIVTDINGSKNVAGAGVNVAQRVMGVADGNQILVSTVVFETLRHRERYMRSFRGYSAVIKHGATLVVYQFCEEGHPGLLVDTPSQFRRSAPTESRLTELEAYYVGHALKHRQFLIQSRGPGQNDYAAVLLLWFLAQDSVSEAHRADYEKPNPKIFGEGSVSIEKVYRYYMSLHFWVCVDLAQFVEKELSGIRPLIEESSTQFYIVNKKGKEKLRSEYPEIWTQLQLDDVA